MKLLLSMSWNTLPSGIPTRSKFTAKMLTAMVSLLTASTALFGQTLLFETFETNDALPGSLPSGWVTNSVYSLDSSSTTQAFKIWDDELINSSGRWGVPNRVGSSRFAAANDRATPCDCIYQNSYLETPSLDFTGVTNPGMRFVIFNDDFRIGATAYVTYSTNNGLSWTAVQYYPNTNNSLPEHPSQWKMVALNLDTLVNEPNVRIRLNWYDADELTNGIAIDDIYIGSLSEYSISNERLNYGNYVAPNFSSLNSSYTMIPLSQVHAVSATSMVYNSGLLPVTNVELSIEIEKEGLSLGTWNSSTLSQLDYLRKTYLTAQTNFTPTEIGNYSITSEVTIQNTDGTLNDDISSTSFQITECTFALDQGDAIGGYVIDPGEFAGNVFDIYQSESIQAVQASIYAGTPEGANLYATISEIISYDTTTEDVNTTPVTGAVSLNRTISSSDLTTGSFNNFLCFEFPEPILLDAGKKYFVAIHGDTTFNVSISGGSDLERSWIVSDSTYSSYNRSMMVRLIGSCSTPCFTEVNSGCTNPEACNYSNLAISDDGSCQFPGMPCDDGYANTFNDEYQLDCTCSGVESPLNYVFLNPTICDANGPESSQFDISIEARFAEPLQNSTVVIELSCGAVGLIESFTGAVATYNFTNLPGTGESCVASAYVLENNSILIEPASFVSPICCSSTNYFTGNETTSYCLNDSPEAITSISLAPPMDAAVQWNIVNFNGTITPIEGNGYSYLPATNAAGSTRYRPTIIEYTGCYINTPDYTINVIDGSEFVGYTNDRYICESHTAIVTPFVDPIGGDILWSTDEIDPILLVSPTEDATYNFTYTIGNCVEYSDSINVFVEQLPQITTDNSVLCGGETTNIGIFDNSYDITFLWSTGSQNPVISVNPTQTTEYFVDLTYNSCNNSNQYCIDEVSQIYCNEFTHFICNPCAVTQEIGPQLIPCINHSDYYPVWNSDNNEYSVINYGNYNYYYNDYTQINYCSGITSYHTGLSSEPYYYYNSAIRDSITIFVGIGNPCDDNNPCTINDTINEDCYCSGIDNCAEISIIQQPTSILACFGDNATLSIIATGSNLQYQWFRNGIPINNANNSILQLNPIGSSNVGQYYVQVFNASQIIVSNTVNVSLSGNLIITEQPPSVVAYCIGSNPTAISVSASAGIEYTYQWFINSIESTIDGIPINGATSQDYFPSTQEQGTKYYYCRIVSPGGCEALSEICTVNIVSGDEIYLTVYDQEICPGTTVNMLALPSILGGDFLWVGDDVQNFSFTPAIAFATPTTTSTYEVYYTIGNCLAIAGNITINVLPEPSVVIVETSPICYGEPIELTAYSNVPGGSFLWSNGATTPTILVSPSTSTSYSVEYSVADCGAQNEICFDPNIADYFNSSGFFACPAIYDPVCACSDFTLGNSCDATIFYGAINYTNGECSAITYLSSDTTTIEVYTDCNQISISSSGCDGSVFYLNGQISVNNPPSTGTLTITSSCGFFQVISAPFSNNIPFSFQEYGTTFPFLCTLEASFSLPNAPIIAPTEFILDACCSDTPPYVYQEVPSSLVTCQNSTDTPIEVIVYGFPYTVQWFSSDNINGPYVPENSPLFETLYPSTNVAGTKYYLCQVYDTGCYGELIYSGICEYTVLPATIAPTFDHFGPYCAGSTIPALPTTSTNGITGTWSPAINNQTTTTYTFTPDADQCSFSYSTTIPITPVPTVVVNNSTICNGTFASVSATVTPAGNYNYVWNVPNGVPNPGNVASFNTAIAGNYSVVVSQTCTYSPVVDDYVCQAIYLPVCGCDGITYGNDCEAFVAGVSSYIDGECNGTENFICPSAPATGTVTILPALIPTFGTFGPYCAGSTIPALPTTSLNGIQGTWSPAINNLATTTYTFTPNSGQCASSVTRIITITPNTTPSFGTFGPYCAGTTIPALPTTSLNGIQGTWSPTINNQTTTTYTFTPNSGQCASSVTRIITITPNSTPSFGTFGPYCAGSSIPALPTTSTNGIQGLWSPAINNLATTTYTFTPNSGQCASSVTQTITITPTTIPSFGTFGPYCAGSSIPALPTTSTNGIQGLWSPAINNLATTTYTFTPNSGQCASSVTATIIITPATTPTFGPFNSYCAGSTIPALPTTSINGIQGTWSPAVNNLATTTYTFTPTSGQCASSVTATIIITPTVVPAFNTPSPYCQSSAFPALPTTSNNGISGTWAPTVNNQTTTTYTFTPNAGVCATSVDLTISILPSVTPAFSVVDTFCAGSSIPALPTVSDNGITGSWSPGINNQATTAYVFTPTAGQCAVTTTQTIAVGAAVNAAITVIGNNSVLSCSNPQITLVASGGNSYAWSGGLGNASIANVTAAGIYTVTVSSSAGCVDTETITITEAVVNTPFAGNDGQVALCSNDAATDLFSYLGGAAQTGGVWSGPSGTLAGGLYNPSLHAPGIYLYVVSDATGCATDTSQVVVSETIFIQPDVQYDSPFCASENEVQLPSSLTPSNGTFSISPSNGLNISPTGAINPSLSTIGTYNITYSIGGVCEASDFALVIIEEIPTAIIQASSTVVCPGETVTLTASGGLTYEWSNGNTSNSITVDETQAGSYSVIATNDGGCSDISNTINVTLGALPNPSISASGSLNICPGESVTLAASGGAEWLWNTGETSQTIEADATGNYWVIVTNAVGCSDTSTVVVVTNTNGAGSTISPASSITICEGDQVTVTAQPAGQTYLWSTGETSQSITVDESGVFSVSTINAGGCAGEASVTVTSINNPPVLTIPDITICGGETATLCAAPADAYEWISSTNANFQNSDACITVSEGGTYTVTMTNGGLCSSTGDVTVEAIAFITCYQDLDSDGFGNDNITIQSCECPPGYSTQPGDCNDNDLGMSPALNEICGDNIDNDCDGLTDGFCEVVGCTDPDACAGSFNPDANADDGSCVYPGCTYPSAINYDPSAGCDDGSCIFAPPVEGCMDAIACNYDELATTDDGSCTYPGCNDPLACNFSDAAGCDDGSCDYLTLYEIQGDSLYQTPEAFCETSYWYPSTQGSTYTWNADGGTIDAQLQGTDSIMVFWASEGLGSVSVYETTESGCIGATVTLAVTIQPNPDNSCPTSVNEQTAIELLAYPNPTTGNFMLQIDENARGAELMVYDALGKLVVQKTLQQLQTTIESEQWSAGVYTLLIRTTENAASLRIIKE